MNDNRVWFRRRDRVDSTAARGGGRGRARLRARPEVLLLEDRRLMTTTITVTSTADSGQGTLRNAIEQADLLPASAGSAEIDFDLGGAATIGLTSGQLELSNMAVPITIDGPGAGELDIDGNHSSRVFQIDPNVTATLSDLTISGGYSAGDPSSNAGGGGINNLGTVALNQIILSGNSSFHGAALYDSGTATMTDCTVTGNNGNGQVVVITGQAASVSIADSNFTGNLYDYAVVAVFQGEALTITGTTFHDNTGFTGGSVIQTAEDNGPTTLVGCTISGNSQMSGIFTQYTPLAVVSCSITGNAQGVAAFGGQSQDITGTTISGNRGFGGLLLRGPGLSTVDNCTISDNYSSFYGGGVSGGNTLEMRDCTISGNSSFYGGGGVYLGGTATLTDCTIEGNEASGYNGPYPARGGGVLNEGTGQLINCTVTGNEAIESGGIYNYAHPYNPTSGAVYRLTLTNAIVAGNTDLTGAPSDIADYGDPADITGSYNLIGTGGSGGLTAAGHNLLNVANPGLTPLGDYGGPTETMALQPNSPAPTPASPSPG